MSQPTDIDGKPLAAGWPRVGVCLECRAEVTTCDEDGAHSCGGYVIVCAGKDSAEQAIEFANRMRAEVDAALVAVEEFLRWHASDPSGYPPYASAIAHPLTRLDESFAALRAVEDVLRAERDELAAEVSAYQGRPDGALPGWAWSDDDNGYVRVVGDDLVLCVVYHEWSLYDHGERPNDGRAEADGPRAAMRAAEAAARSRGWL